MRTVILEHRAQAALDAAIKEYPRLEEVWLGLELLISKHPAKGYRLPVRMPPTYLIGVKKWGDVPALVLLYTVTPNEVNVRSLRLDLDES
jgi:hypothetical protein